MTEVIDGWAISSSQEWWTSDGRFHLQQYQIDERGHVSESINDLRSRLPLNRINVPTIWAADGDEMQLLEDSGISVIKRYSGGSRIAVLTPKLRESVAMLNAVTGCSQRLRKDMGISWRGLGYFVVGTGISIGRNPTGRWVILSRSHLNGSVYATASREIGYTSFPTRSSLLAALSQYAEPPVFD